ncbi:MAG: hypothetical protein WC554_06090 [Clostridia bacterium]|jgi:hypothetical protein
MGQLDDLVREMIKKGAEIAATDMDLAAKAADRFEWKPGDNKLTDPEFQDEYVDHCMESVGLVFCVTCQKMIDDEKHDIKHVFAHNSKEIREKSVLERMAGNIIEEPGNGF